MVRATFRSPENFNSIDSNTNSQTIRLAQPNLAAFHQQHFEMAPRKTAAGAAPKRKATKRNLKGDEKKIETAKQTTGMVDQSQSALMSLPAEMRHRVYEDIFKAKAFGNLAFWSKKGHRNKPPGILMACKQSYEDGEHDMEMRARWHSS